MEESKAYSGVLMKEAAKTQEISAYDMLYSKF
jgi:hypothetical protein